MKKILTCGLLMLAASSLAACSSSQAADKNRPLRVMRIMEPTTADPNMATDSHSNDMITQTMEALYDVDQNGKIVPGVAKAIAKPTKARTSYIINLRTDAKWENGKPVVAQDFVTSFRRQVDPKTKSQNPVPFINFKNYQAIQDGKMNPDTLGVKAVNKHQLQVTLSKPDPYFNFQAATKYFPLNTAAVKKWGAKYGTSSQKVVSNGAFTLEGWDPSKGSWSYKKNPAFWDAANVKLPEVKVQVVKDPTTVNNLFASGKLDEATISGTFVKADKAKFGKEMVATKKGKQNFLAFNATQKVTDDQNLRLAISNSINRKQLTDNILQDGSAPAQSFIPATDGTDPKTGKDFNQELATKLTYNPAKAKKLWQKVQQKAGKKEISLDLLTNDDDGQKKVGEFIQSSVQKNLKGLKINLVAVPQQQVLSKMFSQKFDMVAIKWETNVPDPADFFSIVTKDNPMSFTKFSNPQFDQLMKQVNATDKFTEQQRWNLLVKTGNLAQEIQPHVPLYQATDVHLINKQVKGLKYSLLNDARYRFANFK